MDTAPPRPASDRLGAALALLGGAVAAALSFDPAAGLVDEGGPIEAATVGALAAAAVLALRARLWAAAVVLALLAARELDLDKTTLSGGILKSRFYLGDAPLPEKAVGLAVVLLALGALAALARGLPAWWRALRAGRGWAWCLPAAAAAVVVAKSIDGLGRKLAPLGVELSAAAGAWVVRAEEALELGFALLLVAALVLWRRAPG